MTAKKQAAKTTAASEFKDFEAALKALHAGKYKDARKTFEKAHKAGHSTGRMGAVLTSYIGLCDRFLAKGPDPKGAATDELYDLGIYLHNSGRHEEALKYFEKALASSKGGGDHIRYAMAVSRETAAPRSSTSSQSFPSVEARTRGASPQSTSAFPFNPSSRGAAI